MQVCNFAAFSLDKQIKEIGEKASGRLVGTPEMPLITMETKSDAMASQTRNHVK